MHVSPTGFLHRDDLVAALTAADKVTAITHNHPKGLIDARATTHAIWLAFQGEGILNIREVISTTYTYDLTQTVDEIQPDYPSKSPGPLTCVGSVPQAITCALESENYEDAVRNAISPGRNSDILFIFIPFYYHHGIVYINA